jgi:hypothetical protein
MLSNFPVHLTTARLPFLLKVKGHGGREHSPASSRGTRYLFRGTSEAS